MSLQRFAGLPPSTIVVSLIIVSSNFGNTIVAPVLPSIRDYFDCSAAEVALMASGFALGRLAMDLPAGYLTDRTSPTRMFTAGILLLGGGAALAALSTSLPQLIFFRTIMGIGAAIMSTVAMVVLLSNARPDQRGTVVAFYTSSMLIGAAISPTVGGYLATLFGWRSIFVFCALTPLVSLPLNLLLTGRTAGKEGHEPAGKSAHGKAGSHASRSASSMVKAGWPALISVFGMTFLAFFNRQGMQSTLLPLYGASVLGMDPASIGNVLSSRAIFTSIITLPAGALVDRIGRKWILIPGLLLAAVGDLYLTTGEGLFIFTLSTFLISATIIGINVLSTLVADFVPQQSMGRGMGMYRFTCDLGTVAGPFTLGLVVDHSGFSTALVLAAGLVTIGVVACAAIVPGGSAPRPAAHPAESTG